MNKSTTSTTPATVTLRLLASTQYEENYGAHDWDGNGDCPQYWKFKGGTDYLVAQMEVPASHAHLVDWKAEMERAHCLISHSDNYSKEYILNLEVMSPERWNEYVEKLRDVYCDHWYGDICPLRMINKEHLQTLTPPSVDDTFTLTLEGVLAA